MLNYFDSSIILSLHIPDALTEQASSAASRIRGGYAVSAWTRVELASAVGIRVRRGELKPLDAAAALQDMNAFCDDAISLVINAAVYELAALWLEDFEQGLRAGDALHAAVCKANDAKMLTSDKQLAQVCERRRIRCDWIV